MKNPVCERCEYKDTPASCEGCLAAIAYEAGMKRAEKVRRNEAWALQKQFRIKYAKEALKRKKSGRRKWGW